MEYIQGISFADYVASVQVGRLEYIAEKLLNYMEIGKKENDFSAPLIFKNKINSLKTELDFCEDRLIYEGFTFLERFDWSIMCRTRCHGDLTFENIIVKDGKIYLIDFLDSFYNSWIVDMAKIFQDLEVYWSYRNSTYTENLKIRLFILKDIIINKILKMEDGPDLIMAVYHVLLLNLLRILPYVYNDKTRNYLELSLSNIIKKIELLSKNLKISYNKGVF